EVIVENRYIRRGVYKQGSRRKRPYQNVISALCFLDWSRHSITDQASKTVVPFGDSLMTQKLAPRRGVVLVTLIEMVRRKRSFQTDDQDQHQSIAQCLCLFSTHESQSGFKMRDLGPAISVLAIRRSPSRLLATGPTSQEIGVGCAFYPTTLMSNLSQHYDHATEPANSKRFVPATTLSVRILPNLELGIYDWLEMGLTLEELTYIINHAFLPMKLPHKYEPSSPSKDATLLVYIAQVAQSFQDTLGKETKRSTLRRWESLIGMLGDVAFLHGQQFLNKEEVEANLLDMATDVLPLYIESQNSAVIFRKIREDRLTFEYFEVSLPAETVMQECNKIVVQYPANPRLLMATTDDVLSTVANVLSYFSSNTMEDATPKTKKGGFRHDETRDTASPRYISEALAGIIRGTQPWEPYDIPTKFITKRLDDHVLWKSAEKPWRRSPLWLVVRVCLQTTLAEWGLKDGSGYKAFQAFLMASILKDAVASYPMSFTSDLLYFANAKLARRLFKMGNCVNDTSNKTLQKAVQTVQEISNVLKQRWDLITRRWEKRVQWVAPDPKTFSGCTNVSFVNSRNHLLQVMDRRKTLGEGKSTFDAEEMERKLHSTCVARRFSDRYQLPFKIPREELDMALFDFERWIELHLPFWVDSPSRSEHDCLPLSKLIFHYRNTASPHYNGNPEALSVMHLCILELWVALDKLVVRWCGVLLEYSPEIPEDILDPLLLPYFDQMRRLHQVQEYLKDRHKHAAKSGNKSVFSSHQSFANRFFNLSLAAPLRALKTRIEAWATERRTQQRRELESLNSQYKELIQEARSLTCDHEMVEDRHRGKAGRRRYRCDRCRLYATAKKLRITPLEEPLPKNPEQARAIVFELNCPKPFAIWRDTVVSLLEHGATNQEAAQELHPLSKYDPLREFFEEAYPGQRVRMASSAKSVSASHYGNPLSLPKSHAQVILNCAGKFSLFLSGSGQNRWIKKLSQPNLNKE
ncbi:15636_t:CDS:2, partial [Acaulospora colombiana]